MSIIYEKKILPNNAVKIKETNYFVSIIIVTYNHKKYINSCISSIKLQDFPHEIIIVDNNSTDGTVEYIRSIFPDLKIIQSPENRGYGAGNNLGVTYANGDVVVILNPDTITEENWLSELILPLYLGNHIITTPKILTYNGSKINTCGNINHFTGLTFTRGLGQDPTAHTIKMEVSGISGACFAIKKQDFLDMGGFDENFFIYNEDSDFSWRAHYYNYQIVFIPSSIVYHDYVLSVSSDKLYHLERGRYLILRKYFNIKDIILFSPSLFFTEILTFGYAILICRKGVRSKIRAFYDSISLNYQEIQGNKRNLLNSLSEIIPINQLNQSRVDSIIFIIANIVFKFNYKVVK